MTHATFSSRCWCCSCRVLASGRRATGRGAADPRRGPSSGEGEESRDADATAVEQRRTLAAPPRGRAAVRAPAQPGRRVLSQARIGHGGQRSGVRRRLPACVRRITRRGTRSVRRPSGDTGRSRPGSSPTTRREPVVRGSPRQGVRLPRRGLLRPGQRLAADRPRAYGLRQTMAGATAGLNLTRWLSTGVRASYFNPRIREGPDTRVPPIGSVFPPGDVPGPA